MNSDTFHATPDSRPVAWAAMAVVAFWAVSQLVSGLISHRALLTNAFDLSVFDYALWTSLHGRLAAVPFLGQSLFSHHFMPTLSLVIVPYSAFQSPVFLIVLQVAAVAVAAWLLWQLCVDRRLPPVLTLAILTAFLFSRQSSSASGSYFYLESLEPALVFGFVLAWSRQKWWQYWALLLLAMGCKEDVALYVLVFGATMMLGRHKRMAAATCLLAAAWLAVAVLGFIPIVRHLDGLPPANPFIEARYGAGESTATLLSSVGRLFSYRSVTALWRLTVGVAGLCWLGLEWFVVAWPAMLLNLAARQDTLQSALLGHYMWPVLPWLYLAAVGGAARVARRPALGRAAGAILLLVTVADSPVWLRAVRLWHTPWTTAAQVRQDLRALVPPTASVLAMPNLIPHLPHRMAICAVGRETAGCDRTDYVALSTTGDLWPLNSEDVMGRVASYRRDPAYDTVSNGPLYLFRRRPSPSVLSPHREADDVARGGHAEFHSTPGR